MLSGDVSKPFDSAADLVDAPDVGTRMRPKNAATLILVRRDGRTPRVLMGRRAEGHVFMAAKWVFPGGRVDRTDYDAPAAAELKPDTARHPAMGADARLARALGIAAVRETYEEAGLMLARAAPKRPATGVWRAFMDRGVAPDLGALNFIARAVTPPGRARRFDARFFLADARALIDMEHAEGDRELEEVAWLTMTDTISMDLPQITRFVLAEVTRRLHGDVHDVPFVHMVRGQHTVERIGV
jgi:8-oxo-dGTP pyrophosphatase MutT (NUDIX family)